MNSYIIDTSAWIEYLEGSESGEKINNILKSNEQTYIIPVILSELISKVKRSNGDVELAYHTLIKNSKILDITPRIAKEAGLLHAKIRLTLSNFSLTDATIICSAKTFKLKILTTDSHFNKYKEAIII